MGGKEGRWEGGKDDDGWVRKKRQEREGWHRRRKEERNGKKKGKRERKEEVRMEGFVDGKGGKMENRKEEEGREDGKGCVEGGDEIVIKMGKNNTRNG